MVGSFGVGSVVIGGDAARRNAFVLAMMQDGKHGWGCAAGRKAESAGLRCDMFVAELLPTILLFFFS